MSGPRSSGVPLAAALLLLAGCVQVVSRVRTGSLVPEERVRALRDGQTTRREVLDALGPPLVIVRHGQDTVRVPDVGLRRSGGTEVPATWFFDRFGGRDRLGAKAVVYYYREHELLTKGSGLAFQSGIIGSSEDEHREDRLWILIDGGTWLVRAHVHERDGPPPPPPDDASEEAPP